MGPIRSSFPMSTLLLLSELSVFLGVVQGTNYRRVGGHVYVEDVVF